MALTQPLPGYPSPGARNKEIAVIELVGPVLYAAGGQEIFARQFGYGGFDFVAGGGYSNSGTYYGVIQYMPIDTAPSHNIGAVQSVKVVWFVTATNVEAGAVDLSGEVLRLFAIMV